MDYAKLICKLSDSQLDENYNKFIQIIKDEFKGERQKKLLKLYSKDPWKTQLREAPASSVAYFHNAFVGGYCEHVMNVINNSKAMFSFYKNSGGTVDFELEELVFAAMHHDLGKLGDENGAYYELVTDDWKLKRQSFFQRNENIQSMDPGMRAYYVLSQFQIPMTWKEMLGIRLADGLYEECNKDYLKGGFSEGSSLKTNLPKLLHMADYMSANLERDKFYADKEIKSKEMTKLFNS